MPTELHFEIFAPSTEPADTVRISRIIDHLGRESIAVIASDGRSWGVHYGEEGPETFALQPEEAVA